MAWMAKHKETLCHTSLLELWISTHNWEKTVLYKYVALFNYMPSMAFNQLNQLTLSFLLHFAL